MGFYKTKKCLHCGCKFEARVCPSDVASGRGKYCSRECSLKSQIKLPTEFKCNFCGVKFPNEYGRLRKFCSKRCSDKSRIGSQPWNKGVKTPVKTRKKQSLARIGKSPWNKGLKGIMPIPHNKGKGVKCGLQTLVRQSDRYLEWRKKILENFKFRCIDCGESHNLHIHHKNKFSSILLSNNINDYESAMELKELWDLNNGVVYCKSCHYEFHKNERIKSKK